jgi:transcription initiation factor TFIID TATA-box-binding protein
MSFNIRVENIVASASLNVKIPLGKLVAKQKEMEYEPEQFPGVVYRASKPKAAALIFSSGKIVCTGARNIEDVKQVLKKVVSFVKKAGVKVPKNYRIDIENIVASAKIEARINLDKIAFNLEGSEYEPEQFPGLVYRMEEPRVAFLIFSSGKIVCTGARNISDVNVAVGKLFNKMKNLKVLMKEK